MTSAPEGLPRPTAGAVTVYFLGPGFGESQVVVLPDDRVLVVDGCSREGVNHPEAVLRALGRTRIDLLALTHPDLDHLKGVGELVRDFRPERIWRYPGMQTVREEVATQLLQAGAERARLVELREVLQALMAHGDGPVQACFDTRPWAPSADYRVHCLAPTAFDIQRALPDLGAQLHLVGSEVRVAPRFARIFRGEVRPGDHPNTLSLALVIEWGDRRILLAGDVENGAPDAPRSGWKGVLRALTRNLPDLSHLLRGVALVKVAHHGSEGAYWPEAWEGHAAPEKTAAVIAPFASSGLPREGPLRRLREHCDRLGVSADAGGAFQRAEAALRPLGHCRALPVAPRRRGCRLRHRSWSRRRRPRQPRADCGSPARGSCRPRRGSYPRGCRPCRPRRGSYPQPCRPRRAPCGSRGRGAYHEEYAAVVRPRAVEWCAETHPVRSVCAVGLRVTAPTV